MGYLIDKSELNKRYQVLFLYDGHGNINHYTANQIYSALTSINEASKKPIFLILYSFGGSIESAYVISKCCKEYSEGKFIVAIPRQAKSAATLLALGAIEIHIGRMSELGPIDPQIGPYPALGMGYAVEYLANLCKRHPESSDMFAKYLSLSLDLTNLGYMERISESAIQYAERLINNKTLPAGQTPTTIAARLVYSYKNHYFVIDKEEAVSFLGEDFVRYNTPEYHIADDIHRFLEGIDIGLRVFKSQIFSIIGNIEGSMLEF